MEPRRVNPLPQGTTVHVWRMQRRPEVPCPANWLRCLSAEEEREAARFIVPERGASFRFFRATVRHCLAGYLGMSASEIPIVRLSSGKPVLADSLGGVRLAFNVSHSGNEGLLAVTSLASVGVDLERLDASINITAVAAQALSEREHVEFRQVSTTKQADWLLRAWTAKEAILKAIGEGLGRPLAQVEIPWKAFSPLGESFETFVDFADEPNRLAVVGWSSEANGFAAVAAPSESPLVLEHFEAPCPQ